MNTCFSQFQNMHFFPITSVVVFRGFQFTPQVLGYQAYQPIIPKLPHVNITQAFDYTFPIQKDIYEEKEVNTKSEETSISYQETKTIVKSSLSQVKTPKYLDNTPAGSEIYLRQELVEMVTFLLLKMGRNNQTEIETFRNKYLENPCLTQIYDKLIMKYFSVKKTKEDVLRYILRRAFKSIKASIMYQEKVSTKKATVILCKRYFQKSLDQIQQLKGKVENDDELLELFMPYNKKSQIKTMNSNFVAEIFSSDEFCKEYGNFLKTFSKVIIADNKRKKEKLIKYLMECIKANFISQISTFNRFPWLDIWVEDTIQMASQLIKYSKTSNSFKRAKIVS